MEALCIDAADGEEAEFRFLAKADQRRGANLVSVFAEQELALRIADLATARPGSDRKSVV